MVGIPDIGTSLSVGCWKKDKWREASAKCLICSSRPLRGESFRMYSKAAAAADECILVGF